LETLSDSKRILQISTDLENGQRIKYQEEPNTHDINHTLAAPDPKQQHDNTSPPKHHLITSAP
jgi:hypothetical protein